MFGNLEFDCTFARSDTRKSSRFGILFAEFFFLSLLLSAFFLGSKRLRLYLREREREFRYHFVRRFRRDFRNFIDVLFQRKRMLVS